MIRIKLMNQYYRNYHLFLKIGCLALIAIYFIFFCQTNIFCGNTGNTGIFSGLMKSGEGFMGTLYNLAKVLCPLCMIIDGFALFFTRDERALKMEIKILIGLAAGFVIVYLAAKQSDNIISFFESIASGQYSAEE
ncbi:MAG: hypothetical protein K2K56_15265 [Lachnospiraceae bacterium]|nr:hypothetical protein [Lachnospiraceae bacterium]